jgi:probable rRNA maturation factor
MIAKQKEKSACTGKGGWQAIENRQQQVRVGVRTSDQFLRRVMREMGLGRNSVSLCFVTDREMARLNRTYRKKKGTTDVLSFPWEERNRPVSLTTRAKELRGEFLGDIAISPAAARRNARSLGRSLSDEVHVLILHGVLHLLGYDHEADRGEMDGVEGRLRRRLGLA